MADNETLTNMQFLKTLFQLYIDNTLTKIPKINGKPLDFLRLFKEVKHHGGHKQVTTEKQWEKICERLFGEPLNRCGTTYVQALYNKMIIPYESQLEEFIASGSFRVTSKESEPAKERDTCGDELAAPPVPSQGSGEKVLSMYSPQQPTHPGDPPGVAASGTAPASSSPQSEGYNINCVYKPPGTTSTLPIRSKFELTLELTNRKRVTKKRPSKMNPPPLSLERNVGRNNGSPPAKCTRLLTDRDPGAPTLSHACLQWNGATPTFSHRPANSDACPRRDTASSQGADAAVLSSSVPGQLYPSHSEGHLVEKTGSHPTTPPAFQSQPSSAGELTAMYERRPSFQHQGSLLHTQAAGWPSEHHRAPGLKHSLPPSHQSQQDVLSPHGRQLQTRTYQDYLEHAGQGYPRHCLSPQTAWAKRWSHSIGQRVPLLGPGEPLCTTSEELYLAHHLLSPWQSSPQSNPQPDEAHTPYEPHPAHKPSTDVARERHLQTPDPPEEDTPLDLSLSRHRVMDTQPLCLKQSAKNSPRFLNEAHWSYQRRHGSAQRPGQDQVTGHTAWGDGDSHRSMSDTSPSPPLIDLTGSDLYQDQSPLRDGDTRATPSPEADVRIKYMADYGPVWPQSSSTTNCVPEAFRFLARLLKRMPNYEARFQSEPFEPLYVPHYRSGN